MAKAGLNVALFERGDYAGAKNVQGAVSTPRCSPTSFRISGRTVPLERAIVEENFWVLTENSGIKTGL